LQNKKSDKQLKTNDEQIAEESSKDEKLGQTDLSNVNARDFNFLSFAEIYNRLHNITV